MSIQDVEMTESEMDVTPKKRRAPARKSKTKSGSRKRASASRGSKKSRARPASRSRASSGARRTSSTDRMLRQGRNVMNRAYSFAEEARRAMPRMPRMPRIPRVDLRLPRRSDLEVLTDANPLVIGAIGLGLGVVLGTLMPQRVSGRLGELTGHSSSSSSSRRKGRRNRGKRD